MKIKSQKDFWSGVMFIAVGAAFAWGATEYSFGSSARPGPGYFPFGLGVLLALLGGLVTFKSLTIETADGDPIGPWAWKPLFIIIAAIAVFGLTLPEEYGGLGESLLTYALVVEQIARGWMSVSGVINTHFIVAYMVMQHGTQEQRERLRAVPVGKYPDAQPVHRARAPRHADQVGRVARLGEGAAQPLGGGLVRKRRDLYGVRDRLRRRDRGAQHQQNKPTKA